MRTTISGARHPIFPPCTLPGLSSCLEERRLTLDGVPLHLPCLDVEALRAVEWAITGRQSVMLVPADPLAPLSALIPAAVHVSSFLEGVRSIGFAAGSSRRVAVVSGDYQLRGLYRSLGISAGRGMGSALLRDVVPAATFGRGGLVRVLGAEGHDGRWSTLFVPTVDDVLNVQDVDLVVVELPAAGEEHIPSLGVPVVVVARDVTARSVAQFAQQMPVIAWSPADIAGCEPSGLTPTLERLAQGGTCDIVAVEQVGICQNAGLFWDDAGALVAAGRSTLVRDLALQAYGLFHDLLGLALPMTAYDSLSPTPAAVRVRALGHAARVAKGEIRDLYLPMVEAELQGLLDSMGAEPAKYAALRRVVARDLDDGLDTLLVARTAALARAYKIVLGEAGLTKVRVTSMGALRGEVPADVAVLTGMAPAWARWVYRCGIARNVQVLAYDPRGGALFSEAVRVQTVVDRQAHVLAELSAPEVRAAAVLSLTGSRVPGAAPSTGVAAGPLVRLVDVPPAADEPPGLWEGAWAQLDDPTMRGGASPDSPDAYEAVEAVRAYFSDGTWALLAVTGAVTRWRPNSAEPDPGSRVSDLRVGDELVFLDGDAHKDLVAKVLEVAGDVPGLMRPAAWVARWRTALLRARAQFGTYEALGCAMRARGCGVQTQTVRLWVVGVTIGPDDREDVRRLGEVLGDDLLVQRYADIHDAIRTLRGAHVRLGQRLARIARHVGPAARAGRIANDELIDERSGLTAADFEDAVDVVKVVRLEPAGTVPRIITGRRLPADEEEV
jgi:hypothetical protein